MLIVEDEADVARSIAASFELAAKLSDLEVVTERTGDAVSAVAQIDKNAFDVVIADYHLGGGPNGEQLIDRVAEFMPQTYFVLVSGLDHDALTAAVLNSHRRLSERNRIDFLQKPIGTRQAIACLERIKRSIGDTQVAPVGPEVYVSYAWAAGGSAVDRHREVFVDRLCETARARGIRVIRDKADMHFGDLIKCFMDKMAQHSSKNGIFVVLSNKYLHSPFCMYELHEIFRACGQNEHEFARRVRVWVLPDAKIWTPEDRARNAAQWKRRLDKLSASIDSKGRIISGWKALLEERIMTEFAHNTADIIACIAGTLNPTRIEDIEVLGFDELIPLVKE